jgi:type I restriction enzyme S subunit
VFLGIGNITEDGHLDLSSIRHIADEDFPKWTRRVEPRPGDIVFVYEAALNRYAIIPHGFRGCLGRRLALIRPDETKALGRFLFYYFFSEDWHRTIAKNTLSGATVDRIPLTTFPTFELHLPDLDVQRKVVALLATYDDLIENNTRRIAILEEMARSLYREWFVEFRFPGHEDVEMVESSNGTIPTGWDLTTIDQVARIMRGRSYKGADVVDEGGMPFLNLKCVDRDGGFRYDGIKFYVGPYKDTQTARAGDIIMAVTDMTQERRIVARAARVPANGTEEWVMSMDLVRVAPFEREDSDYLYGMLRFSGFADEVKQHANGANVLHLNPERVERFSFARPPEDLRRRYAAIAGDFYAACDALQRKNGVLRQTRDLLLPRLISGELDVSELDIDTGELGA